MSEQNPAALFELFNEIGILEQLSRARLEAQLPDGLIAPHFTVLNHLIRVGEGTTPHRMARAFQVPKNSLTNTLQRLETLQLIEMKPNPEDGRSKTVWLTQAGREVRAQTIAKLAAASAPLAAQLDMDALGQVLPILRDLRKTMDAARNTESKA